MLAGDRVSVQQPSPSSNDDDVVGDRPDEHDDDDDNDACDGSSEYECTGSAEMDQSQEPSGAAVTQQETINVPDCGLDSSSITHFQQPHTPLGVPQGTGSYFDPNWTDATGQIQTYQELPTPGSDSLSCFGSFEAASTSTAAGSQPSWWTESPMHEHCFHNSEPFDIGLFDTPRSSDDSRGKVHVESNGGNTPLENERKASVTLTLSQVDADVAQEIMESVLKHSAGLKIRCIVNDD